MSEITEDCLFCKIAGKQIQTPLLFETKDVIAFNDISPQAPVHILIIPIQHITSPEYINEDNCNIAGKILAAASKIASNLDIEGYRLVFNCNEIAGQTVFHLHCHLFGRQADAMASRITDQIIFNNSTLTKYV
jgi:histidine triad (HIT) family protein